MLVTLYGGLASHLHIVRNSGFLDLLEPLDQIMEDHGFKIKADLEMEQYTLYISPNEAKCVQMLSSDVKQTSNIANACIYGTSDW